MPRYKGTIYKRYMPNGETWVNTYTIEEINSLEAIDVLSTILAAEKNIHSDEVRFYKSHVANVVNSDDNRTLQWAENGDRVSAGLGGVLPLFNTMRVTFSDNVKRPEQKYLRLPGYEANLTNGAWDGELVIAVAVDYVTPLLALAQFVGPNGEHPTTGAPHEAVQNRQLSWHRRSRPGQHRGWVNN